MLLGTCTAIYEIFMAFKSFVLAESVVPLFSKRNDLLGEHFLAPIEALAELGANVIKEIGFDRLKNFAKRLCFLDPTYADVVGACSVECAYIRKDIGDCYDLGVEIDLAEVSNKLRVRCALEECVRDSANENFGGCDPGMDQGFRIANVPVEHLDSSLP